MQRFIGLCNVGLWSGESVGRPLGRAQAEAAVRRQFLPQRSFSCALYVSSWLTLALPDYLR